MLLGNTLCCSHTIWPILLIQDQNISFCPGPGLGPEQNHVFMKWNRTGQHFHEMRWDRIRLSWNGTGQNIPWNQLSWDEIRYLFMRWDGIRSLWNERSRLMSRNEMEQNEIRALWDGRSRSGSVASLIHFKQLLYLDWVTSLICFYQSFCSSTVLRTLKI